MFNQLFYQNDYGTASKQGHYECAAKLSMVGGLTCEDADEFASVYGVETTTGMYDRMIFGVCPEEWDFNHEGWQPPTEADGAVICRHPAVTFLTALKIHTLSPTQKMTALVGTTKKYVEESSRTNEVQSANFQTYFREHSFCSFGS